MIRRLRNAAFSTVFSFEFVYTLTLFCGIYKGDQRFAWLPIDLTIVLAVMSFFTGWVIIAKSGDHEGVAKPNYRILVAFALFVLLIATSYLWSASREYAAKKAITFCLLGFALTCGTVLIIAREKVRVRRFAGILLAFGIWIIVEALFFVKREGSQAVVTALGSDLTLHRPSGDSGDLHRPSDRACDHGEFGPDQSSFHRVCIRDGLGNDSDRSARTHYRATISRLPLHCDLLHSQL